MFMSLFHSRESRHIIRNNKLSSDNLYIITKYNVTTQEGRYVSALGRLLTVERVCNIATR
jgi:hypothetical protein